MKDQTIYSITITAVLYESESFEELVTGPCKKEYKS